MTHDRILIVDDESSMALAMKQVLSRHGFDADTASDGRQALSALSREAYGLVITDLRMPGMDGHDLARQVRQLCPATGVVVVTAHGTVESAVSCVRAGATNYLMKPFSPEDLVQAAGEALRARPTPSPNDSEPASIVAEDPAMLAVLDLARRAAAADVTVLLEAESGAGKEVFARLIHRESRRAGGPFVAVNCAALPRELLEAELFGHTRGAFTGAHRDRRGHFSAADGGTLLLDEIGEMNPDLQARLLRVLQDRVVQPIGADTAAWVDVRVIAATNCNLRHEVASGRFREDLYYRLRVLPIRIPPLRERPADVEPLASRFARQFGGSRSRLTPRALARISEHTWPGNVRELQNAIQRAVIMAGDEPIDAVHLDLEPAPRDALAVPPARSLDDAEREAIFRVLGETDGNRSAAAVALGISTRTLRHKLKQYRDDGIAVPELGR